MKGREEKQGEIGNKKTRKGTEGKGKEKRRKERKRNEMRRRFKKERKKARHGIKVGRCISRYLVHA